MNKFQDEIKEHWQNQKNNQQIFEEGRKLGNVEGEKKARREVEEVLDKLKNNNPYPTDIFTGKTEEGKIGQYGRIVYNNALEDLKQALNLKTEGEE